jgi:hypothetical protein
MRSRLTSWWRRESTAHPGADTDGGDNLRDYPAMPTQYEATGEGEMAIISDKRPYPRAGGPVSPSGGPKTFAAGFFYGLSAAGMALIGALPRVSAPQGGIASDWKAVGADLGHALNRHGH